MSNLEDLELHLRSDYSYLDRIVLLTYRQQVTNRWVLAFAAWSVERRRAVLLGFLFFSLLAAGGLPGLRVDSSPDALVSSVEGHTEVEERFRESFGGSKMQLLVIIRGGDVLDRAALEYQSAVSDALEAQESVVAVEGLPRFIQLSGQKMLEPIQHRAQVEATLEAIPWVRPMFLSRDDHTASLVVQFDDDRVFDQQTRMRALSLARRIIEKVPRPSGVEIQLGGVPILREAILKKLEKDQLTLNPAMMIVCLLVLALTFRWWPAVVAPLCAVGIAALGVVGGLSYLGIPLTILTNIIPPLLIIVGLSDSVHLLGRYNEELALGHDRISAGRKAARAMMVACFLTSLTTAVGFASLATAKTPELGRFGLAAAVGVILAYFATVLFVPAFVTGAGAPTSLRQGDSEPGHLEMGVFRVTRFVLRHARWVAALSLLLTFALTFAASRVEADARLLDAFEPSEEVARVTHLLESELSGVRPLEIVVESEEGVGRETTQAHLGRVMSWIVGQAGVIGAVGYPDLLESKEALSRLGGATGNGSLLEPWLTEDERRGRLTVFFEDVGIRRTLALLKQLETRLKEGPGERLTISFTGEAYTGSVGRDYVLRDLVAGLGLALVSIFLLLALLFRSMKTALVVIPPNVIPLLSTGAYMMARGIQLNMATVITFSIGIGLAVDDSVHVVARFHEERKRLSSVRVALLRAARGTGRAIVITAFSLALGFSVLLFSEFVSVRQFGELIAFTVVACLVSALLIQPALLLLAHTRR